MAVTTVKNSASQNYQRLVSIAAGEDLKDKRFVFVEFANDGVELADNGSDFIAGVLQLGAPEKSTCSVLMEYGSRTQLLVKKGEVIAVGDKLTSDVNGEARKTVNADKLFHAVVVDTGLTAADNPNDNTHKGRFVSAQLQPNTPTAPAAG